MNIMKKFPFITRKKVVIYIHIWILRKKISKTKLPARCEFYNEPEKKILIIIVSILQLHGVL